MNTAGNDEAKFKIKRCLMLKVITDFSMNLNGPEGYCHFKEGVVQSKQTYLQAISKPSCVDTNIMGLVNSPKEY